MCHRDPNVRMPILTTRRQKMAYYVMLTNLTDEGRKTLKKNPQRIWEVNKEVETMGPR